MRYGWDPGCSRSRGEGPAPGVAVVVALSLGLTLEEVVEPSPAPGPIELHGIPAYARAGRLLSLASSRLSGGADAVSPPTVVTPCGDCYRSLSRARLSLAERPDLRGQVAEELATQGLALAEGTVSVRHLLDVLASDAGAAAVRARVTRPLSGLRVAPYYGCLSVGDAPGSAPRSDGTGSAPLEELLSALGADVVDLPLGHHCCGGRAAQACEETATSLQQRILASADGRAADAIAVACSQCRRNLEAGQEPVNRRFGTCYALPIRTFTELAAEAFGLDALGASPVSERDVTESAASLVR